MQLERVGSRAACGQAASAEVVVDCPDDPAFFAERVEDCLEHPADARLAVCARYPESFERFVGVGVKAFRCGGQGVAYVGNLYPRRAETLGAGVFGDDRNRAPVGGFVDEDVAVGRESAHREKRRGRRDPAAVGNQASYFGVFVARDFHRPHGFREIARRVRRAAAVVARKSQRAEAVSRAAEGYQTVQIRKTYHKIKILSKPLSFRTPRRFGFRGTLPPARRFRGRRGLRLCRRTRRPSNGGSPRLRLSRASGVARGRTP